MVKKVYSSIAKVIHPDHNSNSKESQDAFSSLNELRDWANKQIAKGIYGNGNFVPGREPVTIADKYKIIMPLTAGPIADLHMAKDPKDNQVLAKVVRNYKNNDLLTAEARNLTGLRSKLQGDWLSTVPEVIESILLDEGAVKKKINILTHFAGFKTVQEIYEYTQSYHETEIDGRTLAWMWKRTIALCDWIHTSGYIHGALLPPHIMFYPDNDGGTTRDKRKHSIRLVGWANSIDMKSKTRLSVIEPNWKSLYAPEILAKSKLGPSTDLYMGAKTLIYLSGGLFSKRGSPLKFNNTTISLPLQKSLLACIAEKPEDRPQSAAKHHEKLTQALLKEYGPPKWHHFNLP